MATYKIKGGSVSFDGRKTSFLVSFNGNPDERFEVDSDSKEQIEEVLEQAALAAEPRELPPAPQLEEDKLVTVSAPQEEAR